MKLKTITAAFAAAAIGNMATLAGRMLAGSALTAFAVSCGNNDVCRSVFDLTVDSGFETVFNIAVATAIPLAILNWQKIRDHVGPHLAGITAAATLGLAAMGGGHAIAPNQGAGVMNVPSAPQASLFLAHAALPVRSDSNPLDRRYRI